jgi:hydrogenase expression/formation protein HypE
VLALVAEGKEGPEFMEKVIYSNLGLPSRATKVGPGRGFDNGVISLGRGRVMIVTTDPVSAIPAIGMKRSAWLSVHLIASDYTTSGFDPEFAIFNYNFPPSMSTTEREEYVRSVGDECKRLGVTIAAGHTGSYPGGEFTVIGAGTMLGLAPEGKYVTPAMAKAGDLILMTKHAAIEATASLALSFPTFVERQAGLVVARRARRMVRLCTTVADARVARKVGIGSSGVSSMHDATEGGVFGALEEMASASGRAFEVEVGKIPRSKVADTVCAAFGLDSLKTMGEGALLMTCKRSNIQELVKRMSLEGISVAEIGKVKKGNGLWLRDRFGRTSRFKPRPDEYWSAYERAMKRGLS